MVGEQQLFVSPINQTRTGSEMTGHIGNYERMRRKETQIGMRDDQYIQSLPRTSFRLSSTAADHSAGKQIRRTPAAWTMLTMLAP